MMTIYNPGRVVKVPVMPPILWESVSWQNVSRYRRHHHTVARSSADTHPVAVCTETSLEMSAVTHESFESAVFSRKTNRESALISYQHHASLFHTTDLTVTLPFICVFFFFFLLRYFSLAVECDTQCPLELLAPFKCGILTSNQGRYPNKGILHVCNFKFIPQGNRVYLNVGAESLETERKRNSSSFFFFFFAFI